MIVHRQAAQTVICGPGALAGLRQELDILGIRRPLLVSGPNVRAAGLTSQILERLPPSVAGVFGGGRPNTPIDVVRELAELARATGADALVSIGGGSAHDAAKAAVVLLGEGGELRDHASRSEPPDDLEIPRLRGSRLPLVAISTTFSAAEFTGSAGFTEAGKKHVLVDPGVTPRLVILDAEIAASTPVRVLAGSGFNAIDHCVEAVLSNGHQPIADALALAAAGLLYRRLPTALSGDLRAMADCELAAYMSALAYQNVGLGINHAVCHVLGAAGVAHGDAHAVVLPHGIRFNEAVAKDRLSLLTGALGVSYRDGLEDLRRLADRIGLPSCLQQLGIAREDLPGLAERVLSDRHLRTNPRKVRSAEEITDLLRGAW